MNTDLLSPEKDKIRQELKEAVGTLIVGCEALEMGLAFGVFSDSPDFLMIGTDGTLCDYRTYGNNNIDYLMTCSVFKLTSFKEEIRILDRDTAIFCWKNKVQAALKMGEREIVENAGASFVFKKVNEAWKVVYYHGSSLPPNKVTRLH